MGTATICCAFRPLQNKRIGIFFGKTRICIADDADLGDLYVRKAKVTAPALEFQMEERTIVEVFVFGELIVIGTHEIEIEDARIENIIRSEDGKTTISICIGEID